ncbi:MAG: hypothetical protein HRT44_07410, partial [Bdellovibrionales bacterium]|nr:hypothetical protein [Bdellovibrionales bacterium]NQZ19065.1 hypothetical protein [Bdellovibrionales bacterium]
MNNLVSRISTIFKERYGTKLQIEWKQPTDGGRTPVFMSHWENSFVYSRTLRQVSFPLFNAKNELQGIAIASPVENKDAVIFDEMASFLQLTVAEHMILAEHHSHVLQTEEAIKLTHTDERENNNVVRFKNRKSDPKTEIQFKKRKPPREPSFEPVWIYGHNASIDSHIALSIQDRVSNGASNNANEIP